MKKLSCVYIGNTQGFYHFQLLHPQLLSALQGYSLLLQVLQSIISDCGAEADDNIHPESKRIQKIRKRSEKDHFLSRMRMYCLIALQSLPKPECICMSSLQSQIQIEVMTHVDLLVLSVSALLRLTRTEGKVKTKTRLSKRETCCVN